MSMKKRCKTRSIFVPRFMMIARQALILSICWLLLSRESITIFLTTMMMLMSCESMSSLYFCVMRWSNRMRSSSRLWLYIFLR